MLIPFLVLLVILAIFGLGGFALNVLWYVLIAAVVLWLIGFFVSGAPPAGGRRGWYRW
jgi:hypothetical protein